ncbi:putative calmodulin [Delphinella strobiligena]|nr:putative calmodulin [Delphinella strobiligena]
MAEGFDDEQMKELKEVFRLFDKDGDGSISVEELGEVMRSLGLNPSNEDLQDIVAEIDVDNNGVIEFDEFFAIMSRKVKTSDTDSELREAFRIFDRDGSGTINADELRDVMKALGEDLSSAEIDEMIKEADKNGDGSIDYEEFVRILQ